MSVDVYENAVQPEGVFGAVFERDDETAFFYLLDLRMEPGRQIVATFNAHAATQMAPAIAVNIKWAPSGDIVGLFLENALFAVFDLSDEITARSPVPHDVLRLSDTKH